MTDRRKYASGSGEHIVFDDPDLGAPADHLDDGYSPYDDDAYDHEDHYDPFRDPYADAPPEVRRGDRHRRKQSRTKRAVRRVLVLILALGLVGAAAVAALSVLRPMFTGFGSGGNDFPGPGTGSVAVTVNPGDTGRVIAQNLTNAGVVKSAKAFVDAAAENPASAGIQPGQYTMKKEMKAADAVAWLADPGNRSVPMVTIREGLWKSEVFAELSKQTGKPVADYESAAKDGAALGLPASANGNVEGYLFPASYEFSKDTSATGQLRTMVAKAVATLTAQGAKPETMEQTVITASLLEGEARNTEDRQKVARVLLNRLAKNMPLQLDSTVNYGVQKRAITTTDAERADKNPYNTYVIPGLPAGPIGNPGESAISAALHPADGTWLFFVTVNPVTGETKFADTQEQHDQYVQEFQKWCQANAGKC